MKTLKLAVATACLAGCMAFAPVAQIHAVKVAYSDINFSRQADVDKLTARMLNAMKDICGTRPNAKFIGQNQQYEACKSSLTLAPHKADPKAMNAAFVKARDAML